ncbi:MAG TPA: hypothetical protein DCZ94_13855 [Lentisphaeria bacterium]|nr:MAG: hypothetical protein A2X48_15630 [Lentisphaerae bacterium GWF2_49_21]HBC88031.1 hypothetical protein [Lentisphaeria bacterium]
MNNGKHENYEILNLIGYGLAKFGMCFFKEFGVRTKKAFYQYIVELKIAETPGTVKNRQDLFDPFFDSGRKGWWQKGNAYIHRKILIDSLFGNLDAVQYSGIVKIYIEGKFGVILKPTAVSPVTKSRFKQLQETGKEAELYFMNNYQTIDSFSTGILDDARLLGDGYDFQVQMSGKYFLAEIKGIRESSGSIRLTENEYMKAQEYKDEYSLVVVSNLTNLPKMTTTFNPIANLSLTKKIVSQNQTTYHSEFMPW